jgi:tetratricopeptide (TPR) repeat protein
MRLLKLDDGEFSLIERERVGEIPPFAILSHTWGAEGEEVTFKDLTEGTGKNKPGYAKLRFCARQADQDGLKYFWIDACCIDKSSSAELSEAINSMFRWYNKATRCYVYLSDVPNPRDPTSTVESAFPDSRWFTRGWTLQELIAPSSVQFFSREGELLGNKKSREQQLHRITGINIEALQGIPLAQFDTTQRLSWAARRETSVEEDAAYCLLGIFDIHMPLIYGEGQQKALDRLQRKIRKSLNPALLGSVNAAWIVPFERNPHFTGRQSQLVRVKERLFAKDHTTKIAITGLGGMGKTQLALELLYQTKEKHKNCLMIWIPATNMETLYQGYRNVAQRLGLPGWEDEKADAKKLVQEHLSKAEAGQWLLVFDNADDMDMWITNPGSEQDFGGLIDYLPKSRQGCIIFTTRDRKTAVKLAQPNIIELPEMNIGAAMQLLDKYLASPDLIEKQQDAMSLLAKLTYLPLAIVQAAAYIKENGIVIADYLLLLEENEEEIIDLLSEEFKDNGRYHNAKNPVATTWLISFEQIRRRDPLASEYLSFLACLHPKDIPQSLLPSGPSRKKEVDAIGTLSAYSFISRRPADLALDIHRLVHLATRNWLRKEKLLTQSTERAIVRLEEVFPDHDHKNRSVWRIYLPHVHYTLESDLINKDGEKRLALMWRYGSCLYMDGRWKEAEGLFTQLLKIDTAKLGADHPDTLITMSNLASTYWKQGQWDAAEELQVQVLEIRKKKLGADYPDTLITMSNLASMYWNRGQLDVAKELHVQVLEIRKKKLGADHPDTLISMNNLALTYLDQGQWDAAEELQVHVLEIHKKTLGADHPDTLISMNNLALTYLDQGQWDAAEELQVQVLEIRKNKLGADHPDTLISMGNLASTYWNQGQWDAAEELDVYVLEIRKKKLGADHPDTLISMNNLAFTWKKRGKHAEAVQLMEKCIQLQRRVLGNSHPHILSSRVALDEWQTEHADINASL